MEYLHQDKTEKIIQAFYKVYNTLGYGFLERVYHNAMLIELRKMGFDCISEMPVRVYYDSSVIGNYSVDIFVDNCVIIENKAAHCLSEADENQLTNYLKSTQLEVGMLLNFGRKPEFRRKIFTNDRKAWRTQI